ncbi:aminotransferase class V-fold PLP-dependent enzyme [Hyphobacterium sp. HN65]|uniref:Aminotransferase class V-fold PLP-dependent enzyme n=1 Tax=Hyphobacterium lacteum TaxID=3116575 RepID=A0ABU7LS89_9PROT|nr:aminotransferase class V-fold PLP-dependent enzyme [Hyphobacterium sp. HN65]MEE2526788.1 aminotransferase class V-fold PLP-dependent enzyme [Hyphobacterium sp. HN65]
MTAPLQDDAIKAARDAQIGRDATLRTPFGLRPLIYADYAASGRADTRVEAAVEGVLAAYANPHTDDSATGRTSTDWLHRADHMIREALNVRPEDGVVACGSGATGAIAKLQEILGVAESPASRAERMDNMRQLLGSEVADKLEAQLRALAPVVFVGPYEHHSNDLTWRESRAEIVRIGLDETGGIDFGELETALKDPRHAGRRKIGAFSAASNVTGIKTDVPRLARLLHENDAILCLDCAASAPYLKIDLNPEDPAAGPDAVSLSPHKFVGGPGSCGLLVFRASIYRGDLPPTVSGGGTVSYVMPQSHDFIPDISVRERAGTPGMPQMLRAALALKYLGSVGYDTVEAREHAAMEKAFAAWAEDSRIEILGSRDPERRIGIAAFNIRTANGDILHPRYVSNLLSDLFGIQSRAGCSCAGPYGHTLLDLDLSASADIREAVLSGYAGVRPGWCRVSLHWLMDEEEIDYLIEAVRFVARHGEDFLRCYEFCAYSGQWKHKDSNADFGIVAQSRGRRLMAKAMDEARVLAESLDCCEGCGCLPEDVEPLRNFAVPA